MGLERGLRQTLGTLFAALREAGDQGLWPPLPDRTPASFRARAGAVVARLTELGVTPPQGLRGVPKPAPVRPKRPVAPPRSFGSPRREVIIEHKRGGIR